MQSKIKKQVLTTGKSNQNELAQKLESMQNEPSSNENANNKKVSIRSYSDYNKLSQEQKALIEATTIDKPLTDPKVLLKHNFEIIREDIEKFLLMKRPQDAYVAILHFLIENYSIKTIIETDEMLLYNKDTGIYEYKAEAKIRELIHQISEFISKNGKSEVVDKIKNATHISEEQLNNPKYLCFENKVLDLTTLEFTDFNSDYLLTRKLPVNYDPNTTCPAIMKFLKEVSLDNQDMIDYLVEIPADCLEPHYHSQKMHMLVGDGSNGKGTYLRLLHKFLGAKNISALAIQQIDQNFMTYRLNYSLANIAGDVSAKYLNFTGTLKKARGEDPFDADRKNKTALSFFNRSKMIFACQEMPQSPDNTKGWYRSWVISNWNAYFSEENKDPELGNKITTSSELSGFLNVVLEALKRLRTNKYVFAIEKGETIEMKALKYNMNADSVKVFADYALIAQEGERTRKSDVFDTYISFCEKFHLNKKDQRLFWKNLRVYLPNLASKQESKTKIYYCWNVIFNEEYPENLMNLMKLNHLNDFPTRRYNTSKARDGENIKLIKLGLVENPDKNNIDTILENQEQDQLSSISFNDKIETTSTIEDQMSQIKNHIIKFIKINDKGHGVSLFEINKFAQEKKFNKEIYLTALSSLEQDKKLWSPKDDKLSLIPDDTS